MSLSLWVGSGFVIWWICWQLVQAFFWEAADVETIQEGQAMSAPARPYLLKKMLLASLLCAVFLGIVWCIIDFHLISFENYAPEHPPSS